jgi:hypothetical protein
MKAMAVRGKSRVSVAEAAEAAVRDLVHMSRWGDSVFIGLPLIFPDGSPATVKLDPIEIGVRVSDNGFAYRQLEHIGAQRSFSMTARGMAEREELSVGKRTIFVDVPADQVDRAICDVATVSWGVVDRVYANLSEEGAADLDEYVRERVARIFADRFARDAKTVRGISTTEWEVAAIVHGPQRDVVFEAVGEHPNSIHKASASFLDLASLERAPQLVAVVKSKAALGARLGLLTQAGGRVIEQGQPDAVYERAAA